MVSWKQQQQRRRQPSLVSKNDHQLLLPLLLLVLLTSGCHLFVNGRPTETEMPIAIDIRYEHGSSEWEEEHDAKWEERVRHLRRFLTKRSRAALGSEIPIRMLEQQQVGEQSQPKQKRERRTNTIRGRQQQQQQQQRDLQYVDSSGPELNVLVVLLQWTNHPDRNKAVTKEQYEALFSGEGRDPVLYPGGTVNDYFKTISYGEFSMNFIVTEWIMTDYDEQQFTADGSMGRSQDFQNAFTPVLQKLDDDLFDFDQFDSDYDREIDFTVFLHSGYDAMAGGTDCESGIVSTNRVGSQAHTGAYTLDWVSRSGVKLGAYIVSYRTVLASIRSTSRLNLFDLDG